MFHNFATDFENIGPKIALRLFLITVLYIGNRVSEQKEQR